MKLYHGSNVIVDSPKIIVSKRNLDFGKGFYLTSDFEQAKSWAQRTVRVREEGKPLVSVFMLQESNELDILEFEGPNKDWLRFVVDNRMGVSQEQKYDSIIGPVANDQTMRTINDYIKGRFSEEIAIQLLLPQKLKDQYTCKTEKALEKLKYCGVITI